VKSTAVAPSDLKDSKFETALRVEPEIWSSCVGADGVVPTIIIKTTVTLNGTKSADGRISGGVLGGAPTDNAKALRLHFDPAWRKCA
jgi:hypothetical protein